MEDGERERRSPPTEVCVINTQRKGWIGRQIALGIFKSFYLSGSSQETSQNHSSRGSEERERETERIQSGSRKGVEGEGGGG